MRILYVSSESPILPSGGAGTYISYMARAMEEQGHEVFLLTWIDSTRQARIKDYSPFRPDHVRLLTLDRRQMWREAPIESSDLVVSTFLQRRIAELVAEWRIDVVEATDFFSPALVFFQDLQTRAGNEATLCVTYNHGFIQDFYAADQLRVPRGVEIDLVCERQQCRISDLVVTPSEAARARLAGYGIDANVEMVREPYVFERLGGFSEVRNELDYMGRISLSKGIDKLIYLANVLTSVHPLHQLRLIGRIVDTPFRTTDMRSYIRKRLVPALRDAVIFTDFLPREVALNMVEPGAVCPNLGSAETFSYACIESLDRGALPVVRQGTPMAEFFPPHLQDLVLDERMSDRPRLLDTMTRLIERGPELVAELQAYNREALAPAKIAAEMAALYDRKLSEKRGRVQVGQTAPAEAALRPRASPSDITVLMPIFSPGPQFAETVDMLAAQTIDAPRVLICNDGTPEGRDEWFDYARARLPDVTVIDQPNSGLLGARNTLIAACDSRLAVFLDDDDLLSSQFMERTLEAYNTAPRRPQAVLPQRVNFGEAGEPVLRHLLEDHIHLLDNDYRMTALIETEVLRAIGFDATRRNGEADDWAFWLDFTGLGYVAVLVPGPLFRYRFRRGSMSWPWSEGQHVGTHALIGEAIARMCARNPAMVGLLGKAMYARAVRRGDGGGDGGA
ncbi:MAG: glycosyltransferase [Pseudomonadota bacterium]